MNAECCVRCGRPKPANGVDWFEHTEICLRCFTLAEFRQSRDRLRVSAEAYLASNDPRWRGIGEGIHHMINLADEIERLDPNMLGAAWVDDMHRRFQAPAQN
jgi:hypothetical protein